jgi:hypothetical protein
MPEFDGCHAGLCRTLLAQMPGFVVRSIIAVLAGAGHCGPLPGWGSRRVRRSIRHPTGGFTGTAGRRLLCHEPGICRDRGSWWRKAHRKPRSAGTPDSRRRTGARARGDGTVELFPTGISVAGLVSPGLGASRSSWHARGGTPPSGQVASPLQTKASDISPAAACAFLYRRQCTAPQSGPPSSAEPPPVCPLC